MDAEGGASSFRVGVPWGVLRFESVGGDGDIPDIDPVDSPVEANATCMVIAVVHPDIGPVDVTVLQGETGAEAAVGIFDGLFDAPNGEVEVADLVGEDFCHRFAVAGSRVRVRVSVDDPQMAQSVVLRITVE